MNKILIALMLLTIFAVPCMAQTDWRTPNKTDATWEEPTDLVNNTPILPADVLTYKMHIKNADGSNETEVASGVLCCTYTFSFPGEGQYYIGVQATRSVASNGLMIDSVIAWSDDLFVTKTGAFGFNMYFPPKLPFNLSP